MNKLKKIAAASVATLALMGVGAGSAQAYTTKQNADIVRIAWHYANMAPLTDTGVVNAASRWCYQRALYLRQGIPNYNASKRADYDLTYINGKLTAAQAHAVGIAGELVIC